MKYGLIGEKLSYSKSVEIHKSLGNNEYILKELSRDEINDFFNHRDFKGLNITIPYKEIAKNYCDFLSDEALLCNNVNTIIQHSDGKLHGYNTDYTAFIYCMDYYGFQLSGCKIAICGTGGAAKTTAAAAKQKGAREILLLSRNPHKGITYNRTELYKDADYLINATPVGMTQYNNEAPVNIGAFTNLRGVFDWIYTPKETKLLREAKAKKIPSHNGMRLLYYQAKIAEELFNKGK